MHSGLLLFLSTLLALAGCDVSAPPRYDTALSLGESRDGQIIGALEATSAQFFGAAARRVAPKPGSGGAAAVTLDPGLLEPDSGTPHQQTRSRRLGLRGAAHLPVLPELAAVAALTVSAAQSRYRLPQGLGVAIDPAEIGFTMVTLDPSLGVVWTHPVGIAPGGRVQMGLSAGYEVSRIRTRLRSALLDVTNYSTQGSGYLELSLGAGFVPSNPGGVGVDFIVTGRGYREDAFILASELRLSH